MKKEIIEFAEALDVFEKLMQLDTQTKKDLTAARQKLNYAKNGLRNLEEDLLQLK